MRATLGENFKSIMKKHRCVKWTEISFQCSKYQMWNFKSVFCIFRNNQMQKMSLNIVLTLHLRSQVSTNIQRRK